MISLFYINNFNNKMFVFDREKEQYVMRQQKEARNYFKDN